jgi:hypothetical protein
MTTACPADPLSVSGANVHLYIADVYSDPTSMRIRRQALAWIIFGAAMAAVVVCIITIAPPRRRLVTMDTGPAADPAEARRLLDHQILEIRGMHQPILPEDFTSSAIDAGQNAAVPLNAAAALLNDKALDPFWNLNLSLRLSGEQWKLVDQTLARLAPALNLIEQATTRPSVDWQIKLKTPVMETLLPHLGGTRRLSTLLRAAALSAHRAGRDDEALRRAGQMLTLAAQTDRSPFPISHIVALAMTRSACQTIADLTPAVQVGPAPAASREQVHQLINSLLDDAWMTSGFHQAVLYERMDILDIVNALAAGRIDLSTILSTTAAKFTSRTAPPVGALLTDARSMLSYTTAVLPATQAQRLADFQAASPRAAQLLVPELAAIGTDYSRIAVTHYSAMAHLRRCAVALGLRLWMADHQQSLPRSLEELIPAYLPAIPADPLAAAPGAVQYRADDAVVYTANRSGGGGSQSKTQPSSDDAIHLLAQR